jgi:hypothetical protein
VWVEDGIAYCSYWNAGTWLVDVSDPADPTPTTSLRGLDPEAQADLEGAALRESRFTLPGNDHFAMPQRGVESDLVALNEEAWGLEADAPASDLGGAETAAIAREIGGPDASTPASARRGGPAGGNQTGGPASAPTRNTNGEEAADDRRPAESGERTVGGSSGSTGAAADDGPRTNGDNQRDTADERNQPGTPTRNGPSDGTDNQQEAAPSNDNQPANNQ